MFLVIICFGIASVLCTVCNFTLMRKNSPLAQCMPMLSASFVALTAYFCHAATFDFLRTDNVSGLLDVTPTLHKVLTLYVIVMLVTNTLITLFRFFRNNK